MCLGGVSRRGLGIHCLRVGSQGGEAQVWSAGSVYDSGMSQQILQHVLVEGLSKHLR